VAKLHDELKYASLDALRDGIAADTQAARDWFAAAAADDLRTARPRSS
jgi:hypothetical protein